VSEDPSVASAAGAACGSPGDPVGTGLSARHHARAVLGVGQVELIDHLHQGQVEIGLLVGGHS
jgi:hypothetical protein